MITKKLFLSCLDAIKQFEDEENKIYDGTDGMLDLLQIDELQHLIHKFITLLAYCTKSEVSEGFGSDIDYFIYETEWGKKADNYYATLQDGEEIHCYTTEDLWNCLVRFNPEIEDKGGNDYD